MARTVTRDNWQAENMQLGQISDVVCRLYKVRPIDFLSKRRSRPLPEARVMATVLAKELTAASFPQIGARYNRDHTTIMYQWEKGISEKSPDFEAKLREARKWLSA